jgi:DNA-binding PadR family transcriptional regulator
MPKRNRTEFALLGLLAQGPKSGYDIKREVEEVLSHFWHESYGHIYPVLKRLWDHGLVSRRTEAQAGRPDRIVYTITNDGRAELERWLSEPVERTPPRNEFLLKVFFGGFTDAATLAHVIRTYRDGAERAHRELVRAQRALEASGAPPGETLHVDLTMRMGLHAYRALSEWADEALATLDAHEEQPE